MATATATKKKTITNSQQPKATAPEVKNQNLTYDPAIKTLIKHIRETADAKAVVTSYNYDDTDPIGYNPVLKCCNTTKFMKEFFQQYNCKDTYEVFEKCSLFGGAKDREKYRFYNNSADCVSSRTRK